MSAEKRPEKINGENDIDEAMQDMLVQRTEPDGRVVQIRIPATTPLNQAAVTCSYFLLGGELPELEESDWKEKPSENEYKG